MFTISFLSFGQETRKGNSSGVYEPISVDINVDEAIFPGGIFVTVPEVFLGILSPPNLSILTQLSNLNSIDIDSCK